MVCSKPLNQHLKPIVTRLSSADRAAIANHFLRLDKMGRRARFGNYVSDFFVGQYASRIINYEGCLYGVLINSRLRALAELRGIMGRWPETAEAAFSVEHDWQNRGLGSTLMQYVLTDAKLHGTRSIHMICSRNNGRMKSLAAKTQCKMEITNDDCEFELIL